MTDYKQRLKLPIDNISVVPLFTNVGQPLISNYRSIIIGERGPYIEIHPSDIDWFSFQIPINKYWKLQQDVYYIEFRSIPDNIKLYYQKRTVEYADYKIDKCYISAFDLYYRDVNDHRTYLPIITKLSNYNKK